MSKNVNRKVTPKGKIVRRLGTNVFGNAKYDKLLSKRSVPPGGAPRRRNKQSIYGLQLQEKQKIRLAYGVSEKQLRAVYVAAKKCCLPPWFLLNPSSGASACPSWTFPAQRP